MRNFNQQEFERNCALMREAKQLEKTDILAAITNYEEVMVSKVGNFAPEERLVTLYRKMNFPEKEIGMCRKMISRIKASNKQRLKSALLSDPKREDEIRNAWENFEWYHGSDGKRKICSRDYRKYEKRIEKLKSKK